jgi:hypothetical protein
MTQQQQPKLTHWRKVHKRMHAHLLYAEDLGPLGTEVDVEIIDSGVFVVKEIKGEKEMPWLAFRGGDGKPRQKKLGLNPTNCKTMKSLSNSPYVEEWRGWIRLVVVETEYKDQNTGRKELTDAIRIAPRRPNRSPKSEPPRTDPNTTGSGATQDVPASELEQPPLSDAEKRALEAAEREEENSRG